MVPKMPTKKIFKREKSHVLNEDDYNRGHEVSRRENVGISSLNASTRECSSLLHPPRFLADFPTI